MNQSILLLTTTLFSLIEPAFAMKEDPDDLLLKSPSAIVKEDLHERASRILLQHANAPWFDSSKVSEVHTFVKDGIRFTRQNFQSCNPFSKSKYYLGPASTLPILTLQVSVHDVQTPKNLTNLKWRFYYEALDKTDKSTLHTLASQALLNHYKDSKKDPKETLCSMETKVFSQGNYSFCLLGREAREAHYMKFPDYPYSPIEEPSIEPTLTVEWIASFSPHNPTRYRISQATFLYHPVEK
ncbi:MAG: hypothetical protein JSR85_04550 [Proteobacteria bacterium]|nr:hypothetical protein [Pseudomonadota bacterium]